MNIIKPLKKASHHLLLISFAIFNFSFNSSSFEQRNYYPKEVSEHINTLLDHFQATRLKNITETQYVTFRKKLLNKIQPGDKKDLRKLQMDHIYYKTQTNYSKSAYTLLKILTVYNKELTRDNKVNIAFEIGSCFEACHSYSLAIFYYSKALKLGAPPPATHFKLGISYYRMHNMDRSIFHYKKAVDLLENNIENQSDRASLYNEIGYAYYRKKDFNNANLYYQKSLEIITDKDSPKLDWSDHLLNVKSNIGSIYLSQNNPAEALAVFAEIENHPKIKNDGPSPFKFEIYTKKLLAQIQLLNCQQIKPFYDDFEHVKSNIKTNVRIEQKYRKVKLSYMVNCGSPADINEAIIQLEHITDTINQIEHDIAREAAKLNQLILEDQIKVTQENLVLKSKSENLLSISNKRLETSIWLTISITLLILFFIFYRIKQTIQKKKILHDLESTKIENKKLQINNLLGQMDRNSILLSELEANLSKALSSSDPITELRSILMFVKSKIKLEDVKEQITDITHKDDQELLFKKRFTLRHPELTQSEMQLIQLIRIGMTNKEIALFRNIEPHSVRVFKSRIKKKLNLNTDQNLNSYILSI